MEKKTKRERQNFPIQYPGEYEYLSNVDGVIRDMSSDILMKCDIVLTLVISISI